LTDEQKGLIKSATDNIIRKMRIYDFKGYGAFISQMPYMKWFKLIKPSEKNFYCSDAVTYLLEDVAGVEVSPRDHNFTAPVDLQITGMYNQANGLCNIYTLKQKGE
jgi:hypothetical protein